MIKDFEDLTKKAKKLFPNLRRHTTGFLKNGKVVRRPNKAFTIIVPTIEKEGRDYVEIDFLYETIDNKTGYFINIDTNSYDHMEDVLFKPVQDPTILYNYIKILKELKGN